MTSSRTCTDPATLERAADALLDRLDPLDLSPVLGRTPRDVLTGRLAAQAARAAQHLDRDELTAADERPDLLVLAGLTYDPRSDGVRRVPDRVAEVARLYLRHPDADPDDLCFVAARHLDVADALLDVLTRHDRITGRRAPDESGEPAMFRTAVTLAVAAHEVRTGSPDPGAADTDAGWAEARTVAGVLERGAELVSAHAAAGRRAPSVPGLPVLGNADFVARLAAYRIALEELAGSGDGGRIGPGRLDEVATELGRALGRAMTHSVGILGRITGGGDPDFLAAVDAWVTDLGAAVGSRRVEGALVRHAYALRTRHLRPPRPPATVPDDEVPGTPGSQDRLAWREHLTGWLVSGLFARADAPARAALATWLAGSAPPPQEHLDPTLVMLRVAVDVLEVPAADPDRPPPLPACLTRTGFDALVRTLGDRVPADELSGQPGTDARRIAMLALPPLWLRRQPMIRLVVAHRRARGLTRDSADKRVVLARTAVRAPLQFVTADNTAAPRPCCGVEHPGRAPADVRRPCPHRPWGEMGVVENHLTLRDGTEYSAGAVRKLLAVNYREPDLEWLLGVREGLTADPR